MLIIWRLQRGLFAQGFLKLLKQHLLGIYRIYSGIQRAISTWLLLMSVRLSTRHTLVMVY